MKIREEFIVFRTPERQLSFNLLLGIIASVCYFVVVALEELGLACLISAIFKGDRYFK